jgi:hypothetical protein
MNFRKLWRQREILKMMLCKKRIGVFQLYTDCCTVFPNFQTCNCTSNSTCTGAKRTTVRYPTIDSVLVLVVLQVLTVLV